ncbi:ATP-binding cassette domain-containing protein [Paenarthrobacter aurescens]|uniref:Macrolide export ATP-binding/permease protein MacB n=1 Tax=Paenarthrobacter aurescens TaxID=43663 RepID=A0A4Y3NLD7_PAEAU|nr:ATP-binding cassette domain-containing protein [Paenarthrobacter aurescens]MDO6143546.1 ATP-binding cassette domain-containing protein [Paenarthrobacter aurescens]MDO6147394.1 ATP-binding cassette domain-containing protein [Paenarthrobacter aurescens]MDO6158638.1 ATP-binding cassette domain-containing protein [Paenarthrobacter aurescens]MDO6162621.1 ATP-binding cassette domain-containing protein [Paenarthrobacter aurescens]GEB19848.1 macrolide export ATP-binding/permease protein MacB [Paena
MSGKPTDQHLLEPKSPGPLISLRNVSRGFPGTKALAGVHLDIYQGEFLAIVGPSGSGKSTLLNVLGLLDTPTAGSYLIHGNEVGEVPAAHRASLRARVFGFVFQEAHMVGRDAAARNAVLGLRARGVAWKEQKRLVTPILRRFGLEDCAATPAAMLSGGERQRLAIARAVIGSPDVILADEPTGSLDTANGQVVVEHLRELQLTGTTVVMVTHDPAIAATADRIVTMRDGEIVGDTGRIVHAHDDADEQTYVDEDRPKLLRRPRDEIIDLTADALSALTTRPAKALLLVLAFLLGCGGLVAAVGLSESAAVKVSGRIDAASNDEVRATRDEGYVSWEQVATDLAGSRLLSGVIDAGVVADLPVTEAQPSTFRPGSVPEAPAFSGAVRVADAAYLRLQGAVVSTGDTALLDNSFGAPVAMLGLGAARQLGVAKPGPGVVIWLYGQPVPVAGIIDDPGRDPVLEGSIVLGVGSCPIMTTNVAATLVLRTQLGVPAAIAEVLPKALSAAATEAIEVQTVADLRHLQHGINTDLGRMVAIVSVVLLVIASLSAGTTMYVGVLARSQEIALRLALGMRKSALASMFLMEGAVVGTLGGIAGAALGLGAALAYATSEGWAPVVPATAAIWGIGAGLLSGLLSAVYPAAVASRSNPAQLIRA